MSKWANSTVESRFWSKVDKRSADECWEWRGAIVPDGYGSAWNGHKVVGAHRLSLILSGVDIPDDRFAGHRCNNRRCVNPKHLYAGTAQDNSDDGVRNGSYNGPRPSRRGEHNPLAKLTEAQVAEIRERYGPPPGMYRRARTSGRQLAREYGVSLHAIQKIASGQTWTHVDINRT